MIFKDVKNMSDFEQLFQHLIDNAVEKAIIKHVQALEKAALDRLYTVPELAKYSGFSEVAIRN